MEIEVIVNKLRGASPAAERSAVAPLRRPLALCADWLGARRPTTLIVGATGVLALVMLAFEQPGAVVAGGAALIALAAALFDQILR